MTLIIPQNRANSSYSREYKALVFENEPEVLHRFRLRWASWLFNTPLHVRHQEASQVYTFVLTDSLTESEAHGIFHLFVQENKGVSPYRASFGSFEVAEYVSHADFSEWLTSIELFAKNLGINALEIKHYPNCYNPARSTFIRRGLVRHGFGIIQSIDNQFIEVNETDFELGLHVSERRRLRKCMRADFRFEEWSNPPAQEVYGFIQHNRQLLGYSLSFSFEQLNRWLEVFPNHFRVFCVKDADTIASLTLAVRVGEKVLYNFCPADNLAYRTFSPSVLLNKGLYEYTKNEGVAILDLGVSVDAKGFSKPSLSRFKHNLGAKDSEKYVFHKAI
ncbi:GNAT family N-acetyltransferase [Runella sp.]|uniref:GNAT family N-acetyltransferase n=1 Tax=Runella sp. TaxID=1960881 RepID=UPI003018F41C